MNKKIIVKILVWSLIVLQASLFAIDFARQDVDSTTWMHFYVGIIMVVGEFIGIFDPLSE